MDLRQFDLTIFESLHKSLEYVCDGMPVQQFKSTGMIHFTIKEPTPETISWYFSLQLQCLYFLSTFLTG